MFEENKFSFARATNQETRLMDQNRCSNPPSIFDDIGLGYDSVDATTSQTGAQSPQQPTRGSLRVDPVQSSTPDPQ